MRDGVLQSRQGCPEVGIKKTYKNICIMRFYVHQTGRKFWHDLFFVCVSEGPLYGTLWSSFETLCLIPKQFLFEGRGK